MRWIYLVACLLATALLGVVPASGQGQFDLIFDSYIKSAVKKQGAELDPYQISNVKSTFSGPLGIKGSLDFAQLSVSGLTGIQRSAPSTLIQTDTKSRILSVQLTLPKLTFRATGRVKVAVVRRTTTFVGEVVNTTVTATLAGDKTNAQVIGFYLKMPDSLVMRTEKSNNLANQATNLMLKAAINLTSNRIRVMLEKEVRAIIERDINTLPMVKMILG
ncbi:hypothetical protein HDE_01836 [Halotydeus destructor]|nr:hypothetical protein HDE_01836 [Halotydeus destructor]